MCKKICVESPVTQTQRVAVLDSNHLKKSCNRNMKARIYEFANFVQSYGPAQQKYSCVVCTQ